MTVLAMPGEGMGLDATPEHTGPLAEFVALRSEIERRATVQWNVLALQVTIAGAVFGFALSGANRETILLTVPITTYMTFGRYVTNAACVNMIGQYIRTQLSSKVPGGLSWEEWRLNNSDKSEIWLFTRLHFAGVVYPGVSTLALAGFVLSAIQNKLAAEQPWFTVSALAAVVFVETLLTTIIVATLWRLRHFSEGRQSPGDTQPQNAAFGAIRRGRLRIWRPRRMP